MFDRVTMNLVGASKRYETLEGKQYLVVPTVALTVGVHNGSQGPLYYPAEELSKDPLVWNHKPVVVPHPMLNGEGASACDPFMIEKHKVGLIFNASWDGRLKMESWLDEEKLKVTAPGVLTSINNNQMVEVSTGLFHDKEMTPGNFNGEAYTAIVRNIRPDHLAILTNEVGACSILDGAGLLRNADGEVLSYGDIREQLRGLLNPPPPVTEEGEIPSISTNWAYIADVYPKYAIYEQNDKSFKVGYKVRSGKVSLDGEPEEVRKKTSYVTVNGQLMGLDRFCDLREAELPATLTVNDSISKETGVAKPTSNMTQPGDLVQPEPTPNNAPAPTADATTTARHGQVEELISSGAWTEADRHFLIGIPEAQFAKIRSSAIASISTPTQIPAVSGGNVSVLNRQQSPPPMDVNAYLNMLPPPIRGIVTNALAASEREKAQLVAVIIQNQNNAFSKEWLMTQEPDFLRGIAALAGAPQQPQITGNWGGQGVQTPPMFANNPPIQNVSQVQPLPILGVFDSEQAG